MATQKVRKSSFDKMLDVLAYHNQKIILGVGVLTVCLLLFFGRNLWISYQNRSAQGYFGVLMVEYNQALRDKNADWEMLRQKFEKGFAEHSRSSLVAFYKSYMVNILLQQNKKDEAAQLLDSIISDTSSSSLNALYAMDKALFDLDSNDSEIQKKGENSLRALADDVTNLFRDTAQFYLGRYYWSHDKLDDARQVWQRLVDEQADEKAAPSPWAQQVKEYLKVQIV